ncbi:MAG: ABC transporter ATP-binding protein [Erysipelotrichales bacterium]|nr:ABC transporter ATP-binding protein [Erysipelotrichales bacterium]
MKSLLTFEDVSKSFFTETGKTEVLSKISFTLHEDEIIAVIGPSGCGKSTILNLASSLDLQTSGEIKKDGNIGYMFQRDNLFMWRNVLDNIKLGLEISKTLNKDNLNYVNDLINKYGLKDFSKYYPNELSGGMRQRVALIRTLALKPDVLLLDEPFSALDYQTRLFVLDDVYKIIKSEKKSAIIVTHDISEAISVADKVIVLSNRPCIIKKVLNIKLTIDGERTPTLARKSKEFQKYFDLIYKELNSYEAD